MDTVPTISKSATTAFAVGMAEMFGMFSAIWILRNRRAIAEQIKFEIRFWRGEADRHANAVQEAR